MQGLFNGQLNNFENLIHITMNTHFRDIQAFHFHFSGNTDRRDFIGYFKEEIHHRKDKNETGKCADTLCGKLTGISIEQSFHGTGNSVPAISIGTIRE